MKSTFVIHREVGLGSKLSVSDLRKESIRSGHVDTVLVTNSRTRGSAMEPVRESSSWRITGLLVLEGTDSEAIIIPGQRTGLITGCMVVQC